MNMNEKTESDMPYYSGKGCQCCAKSEIECCCDVDWTDPRIYELERERDEARREAERWQRIANDYKSNLPLLPWQLPVSTLIK